MFTKTGGSSRIFPRFYLLWRVWRGPAILKSMRADSLAHLDCHGYVLVRDVVGRGELAELAARLADALLSDRPAVLRSRGRTYGSRDLVALLPEVAALPRRPLLHELVAQVLGPRAGVVRALFFDKPPDRAWSLPWHKDRTIAVADNTLPSANFLRPTTKAGIPHVEAPESLLAEMLALRVHLDPMTPANGPLSVIPGSHRPGAPSPAPPVELHAAAGDVLAMRPLLSHSSSLPRAGNTAHRRVIHLELAPRPELPDGFEWHSFLPLAPAGRST
jgi:ectoine hydroxylase-related dioxygenase (phytanoyl-CoA dioxygenase family)